MTIQRTECLPAGKRSGFTLMELLTVMAIMILIMAMATGAYFGFIKTTALRGVTDGLTRVLALARQHAMTKRVRAYVLFDAKPGGDTGTNYMYRVVAQEGAQDVRQTDTAELHSEFDRWVPGKLVGGELYNLSTGAVVTNITGNDAKVVYGALSGGTSDKWHAGDRFGWVIHHEEVLPSTLRFEGDPEDVVFEPDGTTGKAGNGDYEIRIEEIVGADDRKGKVAIVVRGMTGEVSVQ